MPKPDESYLLEALRKHPFVLAPMAGVTDNPFRSFMKELGAGVLVTELASTHAIVQGPLHRTRQLLSFSEEQHPIGLQIFGGDAQIMAKAAYWLQEELQPDFIDINLGCPVKKVTQKGGGAALLKDLPRLAELLAKVKKALTIPLTIKIRTGWSQRCAKEVCQMAFDEGITWVAIHGRTQVQGYSGQADWDYIAAVAQKAPLPVIGNGDIHTAAEAVERYTQTACAGVMIGRGALRNPCLFQQALALWHGQPVPASPPARTLFLRLQAHLSKHLPPRVVCLQLKKFASWFSTGHSGVTQFRRELFQCSELSEVIDKAVDYFQKAQEQIGSSTSPPPKNWMNQGHG